MPRAGTRAPTHFLDSQYYTGLMPIHLTKLLALDAQSPTQRTPTDVQDVLDFIRADIMSGSGDGSRTLKLWSEKYLNPTPTINVANAKQALTTVKNFLHSSTQILKDNVRVRASNPTAAQQPQANLLPFAPVASGSSRRPPPRTKTSHPVSPVAGPSLPAFLFQTPSNNFAGADSSPQPPLSPKSAPSSPIAKRPKLDSEKGNNPFVVDNAGEKLLFGEPKLLDSSSVARSTGKLVDAGIAFARISQTQEIADFKEWYNRFDQSIGPSVWSINNLADSAKYHSKFVNLPPKQDIADVKAHQSAIMERVFNALKLKHGYLPADAKQNAEHFVDQFAKNPKAAKIIYEMPYTNFDSSRNLEIKMKKLAHIYGVDKSKMKICKYVNYIKIVSYLLKDAGNSKNMATAARHIARQAFLSDKLDFVTVYHVGQSITGIEVRKEKETSELVSADVDTSREWLSSVLLGAITEEEVKWIPLFLLDDHFTGTPMQMQSANDVLEACFASAFEGPFCTNIAAAGKLSHVPSTLDGLVDTDIFRLLGKINDSGQSDWQQRLKVAFIAKGKTHSEDSTPDDSRFGFLARKLLNLALKQNSTVEFFDMHDRVGPDVDYCALPLQSSLRFEEVFSSQSKAGHILIASTTPSAFGTMINSARLILPEGSLASQRSAFDNGTLVVLTKEGRLIGCVGSFCSRRQLTDNPSPAGTSTAATWLGTSIIKAYICDQFKHMFLPNAEGAQMLYAILSHISESSWAKTAADERTIHLSNLKLFRSPGALLNLEASAYTWSAQAMRCLASRVRQLDWTKKTANDLLTDFHLTHGSSSVAYITNSLEFMLDGHLFGGRLSFCTVTIFFRIDPITMHVDACPAKEGFIDSKGFAKGLSRPHEGMILGKPGSAFAAMSDGQTIPVKLVRHPEVPGALALQTMASINGVGDPDFLMWKGPTNRAAVMSTCEFDAYWTPKARAFVNQMLEDNERDL